MDNSARIKAVQHGLDAHQDATKDYDSSPEEAVIDLLTNLRHYCHASDIDFTQAVRISKYHFEAE